MEMHYRSSRLFLALLLYSGAMQIVLAFNFNIERPVTSSNPSSATDAGNRQLFGFQVVQFDPSPQSQNPAILVSAPMVDGMMYKRQGGVYLCNASSDCSLMDRFWETDNDLNTDILKFSLSTDNASYEGEMLGFTVKAFPDNIVVCAPHYIKDILSVTYMTQDYFYGDRNGRCAIFTNDFSSREDLQLSPLEIPELRLGGFDVEYINTTSIGDAIVLSSLLAGAAGGRGRGQIFATSLDPTSLGDNVPSTPVGSADVTPELGYRMDSGYFTVDYTSPQRQIVASAPRASLHRGTIEVCDIEAGAIICGRNINGLPLVTGPEDAVNGYFGSDFAVLDLQAGGNSGTYHSLAVGCPLCSGDKGVVYVYVHTGLITNPFDSPTVLLSPNQVAGRFGLTITSVGDIDLDGYTDLAISAPFEGSGVVYIYRGYHYGIVADAYQAIRALDDTKAFGYSLAAGIDLDRNGYPDLTIGDLSGTMVTSIKTNPLVIVQIDLVEANMILDLTENRVCSSPEFPEVLLVCFHVTPCFEYYPIGPPVPEFALEYKIAADVEMGRIGLLEDMGNNTVTGRIVLTSGVRECVDSYVFFVRTNFTETTPIPIQVSIYDSEDPIDVTTTGSSFGGDLFGMLDRYETGNQKISFSREYSVLFNVSCSGGDDPELCEPDYVVTLDQDFTSVTSDNALILADNNVFGYEISIKNEAEDDGLSPQLYVNLPVGILFLKDRAESLTKSAVSECTSTQSTVVECQLKNPILSQSVIELKLYFTFNTSAIPLEKETLEIEFMIVDGKTGSEEFSRTERVTLDAIAGYNLALSVGQDEVLADTIAVQSPSSLPVNETGPEVSFSFVLSHTRFDTNGTAIPRTLLRISFPNEILQEDNNIPLLVPTEIIRDPQTTCSHYNAIPEGYIASAPISFDIPAVVNETVDAHEDCAREGLRCGVILCTITDLRPSSLDPEDPVPPANLQLFARLYSPTVTTRIIITVYATVESETELPKIEDDSITSAADSFVAIPSIREAAKDCIPWWIVAVSVVAGIVVLCIIIFVLGCLGVFRRWYKTRKEEATMWMDHPDDDEFVYRQRTIPPIPGVNTARETSPELVAFRTTTTDDASARKEKEAEAEAEREMELQLQMTHTQEQIRSSGSPQPAVPPEEELEKYEFDPHKGVDDGYGGPFETEI